MKISDVLSQELTSSNFPGRSKKRILENIAQLVTSHLGGSDELCDQLLDNFVAREKLGALDSAMGLLFLIAAPLALRRYMAF